MPKKWNLGPQILHIWHSVIKECQILRDSATVTLVHNWISNLVRKSSLSIVYSTDADVDYYDWVNWIEFKLCMIDSATMWHCTIDTAPQACWLFRNSLRLNWSGWGVRVGLHRIAYKRLKTPKNEMMKECLILAHLCHDTVQLKLQPSLDHNLQTHRLACLCCVTRRIWRSIKCPLSFWMFPHMLAIACMLVGGHI